MTRLVSAIGLVSVQGTNYHLGAQFAGLAVIAVREQQSIAFFMTAGDHLITYPVAETGARYLSKKHALDISPDLQRVSPLS